MFRKTPKLLQCLIKILVGFFTRVVITMLNHVAWQVLATYADFGPTLVTNVITMFGLHGLLTVV